MIIDFKNFDQQKTDKQKPEKWTPVAHYARTAAIIGLCIFAAVMAVIVAALVLYLFSDNFNLKTATTIFVVGLIISFSMSVILAALIGLRWTYQNVNRVWSMEDYKTYGPAVVDPDLESPPTETVQPIQPIKGPEITTAIWTLVSANYLENAKTTRRASNADFGIGPDIWNRANKILLSIGLKNGQSWTATDFESAARMIRRGLSSIDPDGSNAWIRNGNNLNRVNLDPNVNEEKIK